MKLHKVVHIVLLTLLTAGMFWGPAASVQAQSSTPVTLEVPYYSWARDQGVARVPLTVSGPTGSVLDFELDLLVDTAKFMPVSTSSEGTITYNGSWTISMKRVGQNTFHIEGFSGQGLQGQTGPLIYVIFQRIATIGGTESSLQVRDFTLNEGDVVSRVANEGSITVLPIEVKGQFTFGTTNRPIPNAQVRYQLGQGPSTLTSTVADGHYLFQVAQKGQYQLEFTKQPGTDLRNGLSPLDALWAHRCSMGFQSNCDPAVADVSRNGQVTSHDAALIARWLLTHQPMQGSYVGYWTCTPPWLVANVQFDVTLSSSQCLLLGDITKNWSASSDNREASKAVGVSLPDGWLATSGVTTTLPITVTGVEMEAVLLRYDSKAKVVGFDLPDGWSVTPDGKNFLLLGEGPAEQLTFGMNVLAQSSGSLTVTEVWVNEENPQVLDESVQIEVTHRIFIPAVQRLESK